MNVDIHEYIYVYTYIYLYICISSSLSSDLKQLLADIFSFAGFGVSAKDVSCRTSTFSVTY